MPPVTPPREVQHARAPLLTPHTPPPGFMTDLSPPVRSQSNQKDGRSQRITSSAKSPLRQLYTPAKTPRHRKKHALGDGFQLQNQQCHISTRALFPPTPSSIGSGRIKDLKLGHLASPEYKFKKRLNFEEPTSKLDELDDEDDVGGFIIPKTPSAKVITDELKRSWCEEIPNGAGDDDGEVFIKRAELHNPFISSSSPSKEFQIKRPLKPLDKIVYVNKKGEKIIKDAGKFEDDDEDDDGDYTVFKQLKNKNVV